jgi:predicted  nucleic acid-binding Zn-ribbon protein
LKQPDVEALRKVDALDAKAGKLRRELAEIPTELAKHKDHAKKLGARVGVVHEEQKKVHKEIDKLALDVRDNEEHVKKYQVQQNTAKTNEEYAALKKQIEALKKSSGDLEDKELLLYEKLDALKAEEKAAKEALAGGEQKLRDEEAGVQKEMAGVEETLGAVLAERAAAEKSVSQGVLGTYRRILEKTGNRALAPVRVRTCQGCSMEIPSNDLALLLGGKEIVLCKSCSRILYLEDNYREVTSTSYSVSDKTRDSQVKQDSEW